MQTVLLVGGKGTRLSEETVRIPKPLVEIGDHPIVWHIMKIYSHYSLNDFIMCLGSKGYAIKEYFSNYYLHNSDCIIDLKSGSIKYHSAKAEPWTISLIDTGEDTMTGGRLRRVRDHIRGTFCMTYGDGVSNIDIASLIKFHKSHGKLATVTAIRQPGRFGALEMDSATVTAVREKSVDDGSWVNGGYFVLEPKAIDYIAGDETSWENEPMHKLARDGQLMAFRHDGFWQPMDTLRERNLLETLWAKKTAPWKVWD